MAPEEQKVTEADLKAAFSGEPGKKKLKKEKKERAPKEKLAKKFRIFLIFGIIFLLSGIGLILFAIFGVNKVVSSVVFPDFSNKENTKAIYSDLTGEPLANEAAKTAPTFCIQTPNGMDGARPQSGLTEAGVIFEAIAEAGITRFATIYQNPTSAVIGPIRSLRIYFLDWDTPFDCTIVHAGGSAEAMAAVSNGSYRHMVENYTYMYRGTYGVRRWNNLFTTSSYLKDFNSANGYDKSEIKGFTRMTPEESQKSRIESIAEEKLDITKATDKDTSKIDVEVSSINMNFGGMPNFNVHYEYNSKTNTYDRGYTSGLKHDVYKCSSENLGEKNPEDVCELTRLSPSVVIAMIVKERRAADGVHEAIDTVSTGNAYIFQNGIAIAGTWKKASKAEQIKFFDKDGNEVALAPGQTIISAIPTYGSVEY